MKKKVTLGVLFAVVLAAIRRKVLAIRKSVKAPRMALVDVGGGTIIDERTCNLAGRTFYLRVNRIQNPGGAQDPTYTLTIMGNIPLVHVTYPNDAYSFGVLTASI